MCGIKEECFNGCWLTEEKQTVVSSVCTKSNHTYYWCCLPGSWAAGCCPALQYSGCRDCSALWKAWGWWLRISCNDIHVRMLVWDGWVQWRTSWHDTLPDSLFGVFEALGDKVNRLVLCDWVFLEAGLFRVKGQQFGLVCQGVLWENHERKTFSAAVSSPNVGISKQEVQHYWVNILCGQTLM